MIHIAKNNKTNINYTSLYKNLIDLFSKYNIDVRLTYIIGFPMETIKELLLSLSFLKKFNATYYVCFLVRHYKTSPLSEFSKISNFRKLCIEYIMFYHLLALLRYVIVKKKYRERRNEIIEQQMQHMGDEAIIIMKIIRFFNCKLPYSILKEYKNINILKKLFLFLLFPKEFVIFHYKNLF